MGGILIHVDHSWGMSVCRQAFAKTASCRLAASRLALEQKFPEYCPWNQPLERHSSVDASVGVVTRHAQNRSAAASRLALSRKSSALGIQPLGTSTSTVL